MKDWRKFSRFLKCFYKDLCYFKIILKRIENNEYSRTDLDIIAEQMKIIKFMALNKNVKVRTSKHVRL